MPSRKPHRIIPPTLPTQIRLALILITGLLSAAPAIAQQNNTKRPNVLFIAVDDLRPELSTWGRTTTRTPNIDRLADTSTAFLRAYCMVPTCGASRASLMTGIRPTPMRFVNYLARADEDAPGITILPQHFKNNGYTTISLGKVLHHADDSLSAWTDRPWRPNTSDYQTQASQQLIRQARQTDPTARGPAWEAGDLPDNAYPDGQIADRAITELTRLANDENNNQPFFLAVGFMKPHLPFNCPKKYWDLYNPNDIELADFDHKPEGAPDAAMHNSGELRNYTNIPPTGPVDEQTARNLIHGYFACVSYTDAQVGRVLDQLESLGLDDNTVVVLWGDHGWNLGEHGLWCKHCVFETSLHTPLIIRAPGYTTGQTTSALVEFIDIYPTLCDLAGLEKPQHLQGTSTIPLLNDPAATIKPAAVSRFQRGDSIRTDRYRYSEFHAPNGNFLGHMLYDHTDDPAETQELSRNPANANLVERLAESLNQRIGR